jgi:hypothetical protein
MDGISYESQINPLCNILSMKLLWLLLPALLGILLAGSAQAATTQCNSCSDCTNKIAAAAAGDTVQLTATIPNYVGPSGSACISFNGKDNIIFDCLGNTINGDHRGVNEGIMLSEANGGSVNVTIRNCIIYDFQNGITVSSGSNNTLESISSTSNNDSGIGLDSSWYSTVMNANVSMQHEGFGLSVNNASYSSFTNIVSNYNTQSHGILMINTNNSIVRKVTSRNNNLYGFWLFFDNNNTFMEINASLNGHTGVILAENCSYNNFTNITLDGNFYYGFYMQSSTGPCMYNRLKDSRLEGNSVGIYMHSPSGTVFSRQNYFYNNYLNNTLNFYSDNANNQPNYFNTTKTAGTNIIGGPWIGGNFWANPSGTGFSQQAQTCADVNSDGICDSPYTLYTGNVDSLPLKFFQPDTTPPGRFNPQPSGTLPSGTTSVNMNLTTNESATCRYSTSSGIPYSSMTNTFSGAGTMFHSTIVSSLSNGNTYNYYVRCNDTAGNTNTDDFAISFSVASPPDLPPSITFVSPTRANNTNVSGNYIEVNVSLSENPGSCLLNWYSGAWANYTMSISGLYCYRNMTSLPNSVYQFRVYANDTAGNLNVSETRYVGVSYSNPDATPPNLTILTPLNASQASQNWVLINVSANEPLSSCKLDWNGIANESWTAQGSYCWINKTSLVNGTYTFRVYANDSAGNWNSTETRWVTINLTAQSPQPAQSPILISYSINPRSVRSGSNVTISINATSNSSISALILNITMPNSTWNAFYLSGNATMNYTPLVQGLYNLVIFATDTQGWNRTAADSFTAANPITFNSTTITYNGTAVPFKLELYYPGTDFIISGFNSPSGRIVNGEILDQSYDMLFRSYNDKLQTRLRDVNVSQNLERIIGFDNPTVTGYAITYAVQNSYTASSASVRIYYSGLNEDHIGLYKCDSWNFTARLCTGNWSSALNYSQDKNNDYIAFDVSSFSGFSLKEEPFCGDNMCQANENEETCNQDCPCTDGEKMSCGVNRGECRTGNLTCHGGMWGSECAGEVKPQNETCDGKDNDCDGLADENLAEACGNSTGACRPGTRTCTNGIWSACAGGTGPAPEICNGIDDDCDGVVDNNAACCTEGDTRTFGTSLTRGICHPGTCTCAGGTWKNCTEAVTAVPEICNDGLDNDCDGLTDSEDPDCIQSACSNEIQDGNETGTDCGGECKPCPDYTMVWISLSVVGAAVLGILLFLYFKLRKQGRELTWEELMKKWTA